MTQLFVRENVNHNGTAYAKGTSFDGDETEFKSLIDDGLFSLTAEEAPATEEEETPEVEGQPQDTWAASPEAPVTNEDETIPDGDELVDHEVTEQDLIDNPQLAADGVKVGEVIRMPKPTEAPADETGLKPDPTITGEEL